MKRLTKKEGVITQIDKDGNITKNDFIEVKDKDEAYKKLYELENIEEELGMELTTLFKAYSNGFYVKGEKEKQHIDFQNYLNANAFKNKEMFYGHEYCYQYVKLYDYGKDWALTESELKNE